MVWKGQLLWLKLSASLLRKEKLQSFFSGKPIIMASEKWNFGKSTFPTSLIPFCKQDLLSLLILLGLLIYPGCLDRIPVVLMSCWGHHMMSLMSLLLTLSPCMATPHSKLGKRFLKNQTQPHAKKDTVLRWERKDESKDLILARSLLYTSWEVWANQSQAWEQDVPCDCWISGQDVTVFLTRWGDLLCTSLRRLAFQIRLISVNKLLGKGWRD